MRRVLQQLLAMCLVAVYGTGTARLIHVRIGHGEAVAVAQHGGAACSHHHARDIAPGICGEEIPVSPGSSPHHSHDDCSTCQQMSVGAMAMAPGLAPLMAAQAQEKAPHGEAQRTLSCVLPRDVAARAPPATAESA